MALQKQEDSFQLAFSVNTPLGANGAMKEPMLIFEVKRWACLPANR